MSFGAVIVAFAGTTGVLLAQTSEQAVTEPEIATSPSFPQLLPGYYRERVKFYNFGGAIPPEVRAVQKRTSEESIETSNFCNDGRAARSNDPPWRANRRADDDCEVVAASLDGTSGRGEFRCRSSEVQGQMTYAGEFHPDSAKFTLDARVRFKEADGPISFNVDVEITRLADACPGESGEAAQ